MVDEDGNVYMFTQEMSGGNDGVDKVNGDTGAKIWAFSTGTNQFLWDNGSTGAMSADQSRLYISSREGGHSAYAIDTATGVALWTFQSSELYDQSDGAIIVDAAGHVVMCGAFGSRYTYSLTDNGSSCTKNWEVYLNTSDFYNMYGGMNSGGELVLTTHGGGGAGWGANNYIAVLMADSPPLAIIAPNTIGPFDEGIPAVNAVQLGSKGVTGTPIYTLDSGALPDGMSLSASGLITGYPSWGEAASSPFNVTFKVTDDASSATRAYSIVVNTPALQIWGLNPGILDKPFTGGLGLIGGTPPYTVSVANKGDKAAFDASGLTLNNDGTITGTPTVARDYALEVTVTDNVATSTTRDITVSVQDTRNWRNAGNTKQRSSLSLLPGPDEWNRLWRVQFDPESDALFEDGSIYMMNAWASGALWAWLSTIGHPGDPNYDVYCCVYNVAKLRMSDGVVQWVGDLGGIANGRNFKDHPGTPPVIGPAASDKVIEGMLRRIAALNKTTGIAAWDRPWTSNDPNSTDPPYDPVDPNRSWGARPASGRKTVSSSGAAATASLSGRKTGSVMDPDTGAILWSSDYYLNGKGTDNRALTALYTRPDEGEILFGLGCWGGNGGDWTGDGRVRAMRLDTKEILWSIGDPYPGMFYWYTPIDLTGNIYYTSNTNPRKIISVDGEAAQSPDANDVNGMIRWTFPLATNEWPTNGGCLSFDGRTYYVVTHGENVNIDGSSEAGDQWYDIWTGVQGYLYAINTINGSLRWKMPVGGAYGNWERTSFDAMTCDIDGKLYFRTPGRYWEVWKKPGTPTGSYGQRVPEDPGNPGTAGPFAGQQDYMQWCVQDTGSSYQVLWTTGIDARPGVQPEADSFTIGPGYALYTTGNMIPPQNIHFWSGDETWSLYRGLHKIVATDVPDITDVWYVKGSADVNVTFSSKAGKSYTLESSIAAVPTDPVTAFSDSLTWTTVTTGVAAGATTTLTDDLVTNPVPLTPGLVTANPANGKGFRFYRVKVTGTRVVSRQTVGVFEMTVAASPVLSTYYVSTPLVPSVTLGHDTVEQVFGERIAGIDHRQIARTNFKVSSLVGVNDPADDQRGHRRW